MASTATWDAIEWRSYSIMADATRAIWAAKQAHGLSYQLLSSTKSVSRSLRELLVYLHTAEFLQELENANDAEVDLIAKQMQDVQQKLTESISAMKRLRVGRFWKRICRPYIVKLEGDNVRLRQYAEAFKNNPVLLSKRDEEKLVNSLLNPREPNEALRRAFSRK